MSAVLSPGSVATEFLYPSDGGYPADFALATLAQAAYSGQPDIVADGDVHAVVWSIRDVVVISFRGTRPTDWRDLYRDFSAWPHDAMDHPRLGLCHAGFITGAQAALPKVKAVVQPGRPFALTGHSMGGALALATAGLLIDSGLVPVRVTTFGAPRVGMTALNVILSNAPGRRYRFGDDPFPDLPLWPYLTDRGLTRIGDPGENPIADHAVENYVQALTFAARS